MRRIGIIAVTAMFLGMAWVSTARAASDWFIAEVLAVGVATSGKPAIQLSDTDSLPAFTKTWFLMTEDPNKELAIGLTALSAGLDVWIYVDLDTAGAPTINGLYVRQ